MRRLALAVALSAAFAGLGGCGSSSRAGDKLPGTTLTIYSSLPLRGASSASAQAVLNGEMLALDQMHARIGKFRIVLRSLDDSTVASSGWDPGQTTQNARAAVADPTAIGYLGDFNSGASAISIPLLNRPGIPQISPASSADGLTSDRPDTSPGEPAKYYPTGVRTFVRIVPKDQYEAAAQVRLQKSFGCTRTYVLEDGTVDGLDFASAFSTAAQLGHLTVLAVTSFEPHATDYSGLAIGVAHSGANCVLVSATATPGAALITKQIAAALPSAKLFASAGLANVAYTDPARGGIPAALDSRVVLTAPPQPSADYGYEAMSLMLGAITRATDRGTRAARRSAVLSAIFHTHERRSVLGAYSIDSSGDATLRRIGIFRVVRGRPSLWIAING